MDISIGQILAWVIVGGFAGALAAALTDPSHKIRFLSLRNILLGMVGAVIGGLLFHILKIEIGSDLVITLTDVLSAFVGSVIVVLALWFYQRRKGK